MIQIDMLMPDNCLECRFNISEFGYCNAMPVEFVGQVSDCEEDGRPEWCPLKAQEPREMSDAELMDAIRRAPIMLKHVLDAEPVAHARWKDNGNETVSCSRCATWFQKEREPYLRYCGWCGAKMDKEDA